MRLRIAFATLCLASVVCRGAEPVTLKDPALEIYYAQVCAVQLYVATDDAAYVDAFMDLFTAYRVVLSPGATAAQKTAARDSCLVAAVLFLESGYADQGAVFDAIANGKGWSGDPGTSNVYAWFGVFAGYYAYLDLAPAE